MAEDDPDYDRETDYEDELAELRRSAEEGESWDAPPEVIGAAMVASRLAPCPPLYPLVRESGIPVLLVHATEPAELRRIRERALDRVRMKLMEPEVGLTSWRMQ